MMLAGGWLWWDGPRLMLMMLDGGWLLVTTRS